MGRPKTTGCSHNKSSVTQRSERKILTSGGQKKLTDLFKSNVQEKATISDNEQQSTSSSFSSPSSSVVLIALLMTKIWILKFPLMDVHIQLCINHMKSGRIFTLFSSFFFLLKMDGCALCTQNMGKVMNFGEHKVLSKVNILTAHSIHMKNPKSTQRQS